MAQFNTYPAPTTPLAGTEQLVIAQGGSTKTGTVQDIVTSTAAATYLASPPAIGGTTPAAGTFATLNATGAITPSTTAGIVGTTLGDNANAGSVGEYVASSITLGSAVTLTNGSSSTITSIALTPGDWDVTGSVWFAIGTGGATLAQGAISYSIFLPDNPGTGVSAILPAAIAASSALVLPLSTVQINSASPITMYLLAAANFPSGTTTAYGIIRARRVR